jgi:hypothetical protein
MIIEMLDASISTCVDLMEDERGRCDYGTDGRMDPSGPTALPPGCGRLPARNAREAAKALLVGLLKHGPQLAARGHRSRMRMWGLLAVGFNSVLAIFIGFERYNRDPTFISQLSGATAGALPVRDEARREVGKGQYFSLANIRYCRFQEERIHLMKSAVRGSEDVDAFNAIARDFNSRCSDFCFRDSDVAAVTTELASLRPGRNMLWLCGRNQRLKLSSKA